MSTISTSKASNGNGYSRPTLAGRAIAGIIVGAVCFTALTCLILVLGERRRRSRTQGRGLNLARTQTLDAYPIAQPSPGLGLDFTKNQNEKTSKKKSSRFSGWLSKFGMGKRRGPPLQDPGCDHLHLLQRDDGNSQVLDPASIPVPEGPPPVYTDGICEKGRHIQAQEPFKYDPPLGSPGHKPTDAETSSNTQVVYPPPPGPPPPVHTWTATMPKERDNYFPGGFVA